jgi:protoheme IX farnesyltransferase
MSRQQLLAIYSSIPWGEYFELCKPRVVALIMFTTVIGMVLSTPELVPPWHYLVATLGIGLAAASAAAINHVADHRIDALMARTRNRPLPQGQIDRAHALLFAAVLGVTSMTLLASYVNTLTAVLTFLTLIGYAVIYTLYLKRATPQNIVIGGAAGAAPPILGWTAITGELHFDAFLLFLIIFAWTPPHFWSLAIYRREDYANAEIPMLPITHGLEHTRRQILIYTVILFVASLLPVATGMSGTLYLLGAVGLGMGFLYLTVRMQRDHSDGLAIQIFAYSIVYLSALFLFLLLDHFV